MSDAAKKNETTEIKFRDDLVEFKDKIKPLLKADAATGAIVLPDDEFFKHAPEGLTPQTYERDHRYTDLFANALTLAGTEIAVDLMKENKDLQQVTITAPIFKKDAYEGVFKRTGTSRNVQTGEVSNFVGAVAVGRVKVVSTRTQAEWNNIKLNMRNLAEAAGL